jgi:hypothetical protein
VNFNSADFIKLSLYILSKITKYPYKIYILDNGSGNTDYEKLKKICSEHKNIILERTKTDLKGSIAHGTALNYLVTKVDTPYFSILDADATWLKNNWDEILINRLNDEIKVIGTQPYGDKPKDFPLMFAILFETATFNSLNIDFRPKDVSQYQDTGHELREKYLSAGYKGEVIYIRNTREFHEGPFKNLIVAEYYLSEQKGVFASHFGRGSTGGIAKYRGGQSIGLIYKIPFISFPLRYIRGHLEKKRWIKICKRIVEQEMA